MKQPRTKLWPIALLVAALSLPAVRALAEKPAGIEQLIAAAKTAADHENIAALYEGEAKSAEKKADKHQLLADAYKKVGGGAIEKLHLDQHCADLVKRYRDVAQVARGLAEAHRQMAKEVH